MGEKVSAKFGWELCTDQTWRQSFVTDFLETVADTFARKSTALLLGDGTVPRIFHLWYSVLLNNTDFRTGSDGVIVYRKHIVELFVGLSCRTCFEKILWKWLKRFFVGIIPSDVQPLYSQGVITSCVLIILHTSRSKERKKKNNQKNRCISTFYYRKKILPDRNLTIYKSHILNKILS